MTKFTFVGLDEWKAAMRQLPADLRNEANEIVRDTAETAANAVRVRYGAHVVTGNLAKGVRVKKQRSGAYGVSYQVASTSHLATIFERGSVVRHYITVRGNKKLVGAMPPFNIFGPVMSRQRRYLWDELSSLLRRHGLIVSGVAA